MTQQLGFYFDQSKCVGCKTCQIACQDAHDLPVETVWRRVIEYGGGEWRQEGDIHLPQNMFAYFTSIACNHCEEPLCMQACPARAITKNENGLVLIDEEKCIGCRYCEWVCPYGAPQYNAEKNVMTKCTLCNDRTQDGNNPACVDACPMRALDWGPIDELREKYGDTAGIEPLPEASMTKPSLVITPHPDAQESGKGTGRIIDGEDEY